MRACLLFATTGAVWSLLVLNAALALPLWTPPCEPTSEQRPATIRVEFESEPYFQDAYFGDVIATHNRYLPELQAWRRLMASHAPELARLVKTFPGTAHLGEATLRKTLTSRHGLYRCIHGNEVFRPWTNRWSGTWSNGTTQHHLWDRTRAWHGQWIQPVAQSESVLPDRQRLGALLRRRAVDLAINVYSDEAGITGWVSKRQHGRQEIPCIGYLLEETTLLWLCQIQAPDRLFAPRTDWFLYLERCDAAPRARHYVINGQPLVIEGMVTWKREERSAHRGHYVAARGGGKDVDPTTRPKTMNDRPLEGASSNGARIPHRPAVPVWLGFCWIPYLNAQKNVSAPPQAQEIPCKKGRTSTQKPSLR